MLGFAHTIEKFQGLAKTDFMEIEVGDGVLKNNLISILPMEPNGKKEKGVPRVGGLMPNNAQAIGLQPILYISSEGSNEGGGGGDSNFLQNLQATSQSLRRCTMVSSQHLHIGQSLSQLMPLKSAHLS